MHAYIHTYINIYKDQKGREDRHRQRERERAAKNSWFAPHPRLTDSPHVCFVSVYFLANTQVLEGWAPAGLNSSGLGNRPMPNTACSAPTLSAVSALTAQKLYVQGWNQFQTLSPGSAYQRLPLATMLSDSLCWKASGLSSLGSKMGLGLRLRRLKL